MQYVNLIVFLPMVLIYAEAYGEEQEYSAHADKEVHLE